MFHICLACYSHFRVFPSYTLGSLNTVGINRIKPRMRKQIRIIPAANTISQKYLGKIGYKPMIILSLEKPSNPMGGRIAILFSKESLRGYLSQVVIESDLYVV